MFFYLLKWTCFFMNVFYVPRLTGNWQQFNARAGQKKTTFFLVMRGLNLMSPLIWNREKNIVAWGM